MLFISDIQSYVPIKLCKTAGSIHLFKITDMLVPEKVKLKWNYIWDIIEIDWNEVNVTFNGKKINNLPKSVTIMFRDKFKIRYMMEREPILFHIMLRQGFNWFILASNDLPTETIWRQHRYSYRQWLVYWNHPVTFSSDTSDVPSKRTPCRINHENS